MVLFPTTPGRPSEVSVSQKVASLQNRRFLTKTRRYTDRGRHLEKQRKYFFLPSPSPSPILNPSTSPLKSVFDSSQLSGSINVQDGRTTLFLKTIHGLRSKIRLLYRLKSSRLFGVHGSTIQNALIVTVCINLSSEYMCITDSTFRITISKKYSQIKAKTFILTKDKFCVSVSRSITTKPKKCCNIQMVIMYSLMRVTAKIDLRTQL